VSPRARTDIIADLERARGTHIICYVTSTRPGLDGQMAMDVIPVLYRHLRLIKSSREATKIDLFIHSSGGDGVVPWRIVSLFREFCSEFNLLVPHLAYSAATLTALGADSVIMHPMGVLGPTDPTTVSPFNPPDERNPTGPPLGIAVEDVTSYFALVKDDIGIRHEDQLVQALIALTDKVHPIALGNVKRSTLQSGLLGRSLLHARSGNLHPLTDQQIDDIVKRLTSQVFYHGHPINRAEARTVIGLPFVADATEVEEKLMWELYESFESDMLLDKMFNLVAEVLDAAPTPSAAPPPPMQQGPPQMPQGFPVQLLQQAAPMHEVDLREIVIARVVSGQRSDVFDQVLRASALRLPNGAYQASAIQISAGWRDDSVAAPVTPPVASGDTTPALPVTDDSSGATTG
jgi:hypothetical protein